MNSDDDGRGDGVRADHYLFLGAMVSAAAYAWQVHGVWVAIILIVGLVVAVSATNTIVMMKASEHVDADKTFRRMRQLRWAWVVAAFVLIAVTGAEIVEPV